ncbi:TOBE domain-containing protein [Pleomorphomonas oryzae]|uniref:TOBE domain-containing protein n=1 Tax=Pleomorphomonas oryzae TaxID=261934 RepID=UPI0004120B9B|nr:TOBE domain-containing protein [Pleomorphomonas oryzae]
MPINASITLKSDGPSSVNSDRVRLLEAVAREGSISAGAKEVGITYKAAWDWIDALSNLFGQPMLETRTGGKAGGGATLTPAGTKVIEAYRRMEAEMARVVRLIEPDLAGSGISPLNLFSGYFMRTSARNALRGTIVSIDADTLNADIGVAVSNETTIRATVTAGSLKDLGLVVGREAIVLIKAPFVMIAPGIERPAISVANCIAGRIARIERGAVNAEVVLDVGGGKSLIASITARSVDTLSLQEGAPAFALFDASHVIVAID